MKGLQYGDDGLLTGMRQHRQPHGALLDVHHAGRGVALSKNCRSSSVLDTLSLRAGPIDAVGATRRGVLRFAHASSPRSVGARRRVYGRHGDERDTFQPDMNTESPQCNPHAAQHGQAFDSLVVSRMACCEEPSSCSARQSYSGVPVRRPRSATMFCVRTVSDTRRNYPSTRSFTGHVDAH